MKLSVGVNIIFKIKNIESATFYDKDGNEVLYCNGINNRINLSVDSNDLKVYGGKGNPNIGQIHYEKILNLSLQMDEINIPQSLLRPERIDTTENLNQNDDQKFFDQNEWTKFLSMLDSPPLEEELTLIGNEFLKDKEQNMKELKKVVMKGQQFDNISENLQNIEKHTKGFMYDSLCYRYQLARYKACEADAMDLVMTKGLSKREAEAKARNLYERDCLRFYQILDEAIGEHD